MKKALVFLLCFVMMAGSALAVGASWGPNNELIYTGVRSGGIEVNPKDASDYYLVLDNVRMSCMGGTHRHLEVMTLNGMDNNSTVHILLKGENVIECDGAYPLIINGANVVFCPASEDASLSITSNIGISRSDRYSVRGFDSVEESYNRRALILSGPREIYSVPQTNVPEAELPETGDGANLALWMAMLAISATGMIAFGRKVRKVY